MDILNTYFIKSFIRTCSEGYRLGWHERNGGNLTYRIKQEEIAQIKDSLNSNTEWHEIGTQVPELANEYFLTTGSGKFFSNV